MSDLLALAERCEAATDGQQSGLIWEIGSAIFGNDEPTDSHSKHAWFVGYARAEAWVDAALTLVPEGWRMAALCERDPRFCRLETDDFESVAWGKGSDWITDTVKGKDAIGKAATFALAICAAALRARPAMYRRAASGIERLSAQVEQPIDMVLFCPKCGLQHVDAPDARTPDWDNPPHRSHLCHGCGCIWRPADVPTNGVVVIKTRGSKDTVFYNRAALAQTSSDQVRG